MQNAATNGGSAKVIAEMYDIDLPSNGFDSGGWDMYIDTLFPMLADHRLLVDFFLTTAPADADPEQINMLRRYEAAWVKAVDEDVVVFS